MLLKALPLFACLFIFSLAGRLFGQANTFLSNLGNPTSINQTLRPSVNGAYSVGTSSRAWNDVYFNGEVYFNNYRTFSGNTVKYNFFMGPNSGNLGATGTKNLAAGTNALQEVTTGFGNTATGHASLDFTNTGYENSAFGTESGRFNQSGYRNTYIGFKSGYTASIGVGLTFVGAYAGYSTPFSQYNSAFGFRALYSLANVNYNSAFGAYAAENLVNGGYNVVFGYQAMRNNVSGGSNVVVGSGAMSSGTSGSENVIVGRTAGSSTKSSYNTYVGAYAGAYVKGAQNTFIGYHGAGFVDSVVNSSSLGYYALISASHQVRIGDYRVTSIGGFQAWTNLSDGRFKKDIQENVPGLTFINKLRPITYTWKKRELDKYMNARFKTGGEEARPSVEDDNRVATGFVAQEVEAAAKELKYEFDGVDAPKNENDLYGLRYSEFVVPLVKAVQELSGIVKEKDSIIDIMRNEIRELQMKAGIGSSVDSRAVLGQNYPNPVRQSTVIEYSLPEKAGYPLISISDAGGKVIKRIQLGTNSKGNITVNTSTLPSGVYNYSLVVDGKVKQTRKLTVIR
ncbi:MAG TPA: tail fiber domain-containing protein [Flavitalea sp.]|nr:tail fiber domain-containing protein [Flavitalea sp.]